MKAFELKRYVEAGTVVRVMVDDLSSRRVSENNPIGGTNQETYPAELTDYGDSLGENSTYFGSQMIAHVVGAFVAPVLPPMAKTSDYRFSDGLPFKEGWIYFTFDTSVAVDHNEMHADRTWVGDGSVKGTAREVGLYTGFDVVGFPPDYDLSEILSKVEVLDEGSAA